MTTSNRETFEWMSFRTFCIVAVVLLLALSAIAFLSYRGSIGPFLLFDASFLVLILLVLPRPRLYAYSFLALFAFLGFWVKFMLHTIVGTGFREPTGSFDGSGNGWDLALLVSSSAACGLIIARSLHLLYANRSSSRTDGPHDTLEVPLLYSRFRGAIWIGTVLLILALNGWNLIAGFYQTGVVPRTILPLHLNVLAAWLINMGFALWIAVLVHWEFSVRKESLKYTLLAPVIEGAVSTYSGLSRSAYIFHTLPYIFVLLKRADIRSALTRRAIGVLSALFLLIFLFTLVSVTWLRLYTYVTPFLPEASTEETIFSDPAVKNMFINGVISQVTNVFVDRWIGLEGVLAVSSHDRLGYGLFAEALTEDPGSGEDGIYQVIAESRQPRSEQFDFLTLPGSAAFLYYSGSLLVVVSGMAILALSAMVIEVAASRFIGNPFLSSVSSLAIANVIAQLNFPYLAGIFFAELVVTLAFIWLVQKKLRLARKN